MFIDLGEIADEPASYGLECMCKAVAEGDSSDDPHPFPFLIALVQTFSAQGQQVSLMMASEAVRWLSGSMYKAANAKVPAPRAYPWGASDLPGVFAYLSGKLPSEMTPTDWTVLGEFLIAVHLSGDFGQAHSNWLAARATMMGRLEAQLPALGVEKIGNALASMPPTVAQALESYAWSPYQISAMKYAQAHCAEAVTSCTDALWRGIKSLKLERIANPGVQGAPRPTAQTELFERFGDFNKDWRRIAVTESGEAKNHGFVAALPEGVKVKRIEQYRGACDFCHKLHGKIFTAVDSLKEGKDGQTEVWPGKNNFGRSTSLYKNENKSQRRAHRAHRPCRSCARRGCFCSRTPTLA